MGAALTTQNAKSNLELRRRIDYIAKNFIFDSLVSIAEQFFQLSTSQSLVSLLILSLIVHDNLVVHFPTRYELSLIRSRRIHINPCNLNYKCTSKTGLVAL